ncbi:MAG: GNAT superfamily N-acetyltransferase [Flavobacteriales bacterium]|jgi:GNAT superfamily N-acetyltransferase
MDYHFRKVQMSEASQIWEILQQAILRRKEDGSTQWQDGYPNLQVVHNDIEKAQGFVLVEGETIVGYTAVIINDEPAYDKIEGKWLTTNDFVVIHRVAISKKRLGKGFAKMIIRYVEEFALKQGIYSIKADTNFDNIAMIKIFEQMNYTLCGLVYLRESPRKAYEKVLTKPLNSRS